MGTNPIIRSASGLITLLLLISISLLCTQHLNAAYKLPGYILSKSPNQNVELHQYNSITQQWRRVGNTGQNNIKSIAVHPTLEIIYAVNGGTLGKLNPINAQFTVIGNIGSGNGENGVKQFTNIHGLAYDANRKILYATNRSSSGIDQLIQINPLTGNIIKNSMRNEANNLVDYKLIEIKTFYFGGIYTSYNFLDLSYNNKTEMLYIVHHYFSNLHGINGYKNIDKQYPSEDFKVSPIQDLSGVDFDNDGKIYGTFTNNKVSGGDDVNGLGGGVVNFFSNRKTIDASKDASTTFFGLDFYKIDNCNNHLTLNNLLLSDSPKIAKSTIQSNTTINLNVHYMAGTSISLNSDFEAPPNINFEATIEDLCN